MAATTKNYRPSDDEPFMNARQQEYFRGKLQAWKEEILEESRSTIASLQQDTVAEADLADRATSESDRALELRTRDRQRKLIAKIDAALRRIEEGTYGYCKRPASPSPSRVWKPARSPRFRSKPKSATSAASAFTATIDVRAA